MHRKVKRILAVFLVVIIGLCFYYREAILYGISQAKGQLHIVWNAEPVEEVLKDPTFPDSLKAKIRLVQEIRKFAFDTLGLDYSENYTTVYNQHGKPVLWVVTASEPFKLKAKEWSFPFLGTFSYKGFFKHDKAEKEANELKKDNWDTDIGEVSGWSTLGWFKDPILTSMLKRSPGSLANLIIHELTHGTLYVKDSVQFNENLASFVGDKGALMFLKFKYGEHSPEYDQYVAGRRFSKDFDQKVLKDADRLDSLYKKISDLTVAQKRSLKETFMSDIKADLNNFLVNYKSGKRSGLKKEIDNLNNAFFLDYRRYTENLSGFEREFQEDFKGNFKSYLKYLKEKYPSL